MFFDAFKSVLLVAGLGIAATLSFAQTVAVAGSPAKEVYVPTMTFDVASVRQSPEANSYTVGGGFEGRSSSLRITNFDPRNLLSFAYGVQWNQIVGLPEWRAMFNISAKSDIDTDKRLATLNKDQVEMEHQHMMQALLAERFQLKTHWEDRSTLVYDLVIEKKGLKMEQASGKPPGADEVAWFGGQKVSRFYQRNDGIGYKFVAHGCTMADITEMLTGQFGHPVLDKTGLTGTFDFTLRYHGTRTGERNADDLDPVPALDTAIEDQLGLKLVPAKGTDKFLVVDHIEKPSAN